MILLVDVASVSADPDLKLLLSFADVEGFAVEHRIDLQSGDAGSWAALGVSGEKRVLLRQLPQLKRIAASIAADSDVCSNGEAIERTLAYAAIAERIGADAIVTNAASAFGPEHSGLLHSIPLVSVSEGLALIGANARQRENVPLGAAPPLVQSRTEVYPLTARAAIPHGQVWWAGCVRQGTVGATDLVGFGHAVFARAGQALRARDAVHEAMRNGRGRGAILDALYHLDVVLMSSVACFDAVARVADVVFRLETDPYRVKWQRDDWLEKLKSVMPELAQSFARDKHLGAILRVITTLRNSVHEIPLDEYLHAQTATGIIEHRVMISPDLSDRLCRLEAVLGPLTQFGLHPAPDTFGFVNASELTERILQWTYDILETVFMSMLTYGKFGPPTSGSLDGLEQIAWNRCARLAQVGNYPRRRGVIGVRVSPSYGGRIMRAVKRARNATSDE